MTKPISNQEAAPIRVRHKALFDQYYEKVAARRKAREGEHAQYLRQMTARIEKKKRRNTG